MYRRGVASDTLPFSRPLPLCGIDWRAIRATRLDAPTRSLPRGAAGVGSHHISDVHRRGGSQTRPFHVFR